MNNFDLNSINKEKPIYFIGIGGISMSALAIILNTHGFCVRGSDFKESEMTIYLRSRGIEVNIGHDETNVGAPSCVVYTAAIHEDNPELICAHALGVPVIERAVLLGAIMKRFKNSIAVSGTHGKTTTTSMLSHVLLSADLDPTVLVGGILSSIGGNLRDGGRDYLVTEACEYHGSFLKFCPTVSIILNVEEDHLDYFKDINDIINCFHTFACLTPDDGALIVNYDDENARKAAKGSCKNIIGVGIDAKDAEIMAINISYSVEGLPSFDVLKKGEFLLHAELSVPGEHNIRNALSAIAAADFLGAASERIAQGLSSFKGTGRRFEKKGEIHGALLYDDYAHHPTEIAATLSSAQNMRTDGRIICVFQPHTYTRSYMLKDKFATSFENCDTVILTDIYAAREKDTGIISSKDICDAINLKSKNAIYIKEFSDIAEYLAKEVKSGDVIITMGAGDVYAVGDMLLENN